jgi:hypothetical protein
MVKEEPLVIVPRSLVTAHTKGKPLLRFSEHRSLQ